MLSRLLAAAVLLTGSLLAADPELISLVPPDTQTLAGCNVEQVMLSPLGQYLFSQTSQQSDALSKLTGETGVDARHDLREILVAATGLPASPAGIILLRGTFNIPRIVEAALANGAAVETYKGVQIIQAKSASSSAALFPDSTLAIVGDPASVRAAIDRKSAPTAINSALAVAVNQASTTEDAWFVSMTPLSQLEPKAAGAGSPAAGPFGALGKVLQASGGIKFGTTVVVTLKAVSQTAQDASALAEMIKSFAAMAQMAAPKEEPAATVVGLLQSLNVDADGTTTNVSLSVPEQQTEEILKAMKNAPAGGVGFDVGRGAARGPGK